VSSPLLEDVDIAGANTVLVLVTAGANFTLKEFNEINGFLQKASRPGAEIVPGLVRDENLKDGIRVTIIATGFEVEKEKDPLEGASIVDIQGFLNNGYKPKSAVAAEEEAESLKVGSANGSDGNLEIPAYMRRRLKQPFHNN